MAYSEDHPEAPLDVSVVIPAYKSSESLLPLTERLVHVMTSLRRSFEIIFVEDASPSDNTWSTLCRVRDRFGDAIVLIRLARNTGQHNALMCGFRHARGKVIVSIDDDLQCPPESIPALLDKLESEKLDLVYGNYMSRRHNIFRLIAVAPIRAYSKIVFGLEVPPTSFRAIRRELVDSILYYRGTFTVVDGLLCWSTQRIGGVPIIHSPRAYGRSSYTFAKLVNLAFNVFTNFSVLPLRFISLAGALLILCGLLLGMGAAVGLIASAANPWAPAFLALLPVLFGMQLLAMGLIGEYLGRIMININGKPQYSIRTVVGGSPDKDLSMYSSAAGEPHRSTRRVRNLPGE